MISKIRRFDLWTANGKRSSAALPRDSKRNLRRSLAADGGPAGDPLIWPIQTNLRQQGVRCGTTRIFGLTFIRITCRHRLAAHYRLGGGNRRARYCSVICLLPDWQLRRYMGLRGMPTVCWHSTRGGLDVRQVACGRGMSASKRVGLGRSSVAYQAFLELPKRALACSAGIDRSSRGGIHRFSQGRIHANAKHAGWRIGVITLVSDNASLLGEFTACADALLLSLPLHVGGASMPRLEQVDGRTADMAPLSDRFSRPITPGSNSVRRPSEYLRMREGGPSSPLPEEVYARVHAA